MPQTTAELTEKNRDDIWCEDWIPELSRLCLSLAENRPDGKTGKIGSFRTIATLFREQLSLQSSECERRVEEAVKAERAKHRGCCHCGSCKQEDYLIQVNSLAQPNEEVRK